MQDTMFTPVADREKSMESMQGLPSPAQSHAPLPMSAATSPSKLETGLGAWASAISADDNAQAAIALAEAINRARNNQANREHRASDARVIAVSRLETLRARLAPVYAAIPRDVELFDLGMVGHSPPRLFIDIIAFIELAEDGKTFRLQQESRSGRMLLGETHDEKLMTALVTNYIAERLVERERALAAQGIHAKGPPLPKAVSPVDVVKSAPAVPATPAALPLQPEQGGTQVAAQLSATDVADGAARQVLAFQQKLGDAATTATSKTIGDVASASDAAVQSAMATAERASGGVAGTTSTTPMAVPGTPAAAVAMRKPTPARSGDGGWLWPLLALLIGIGLGALALYLYAANLARP